MPLTRADSRAYALAVVTTTMAVSVTRFTWPFFAGTPFVPLFGAVYIASQWGTPAAGLLAIFLGAVGSTLAFPAAPLVPVELRALAVFIGVSLIAVRLVTDRNVAIAAVKSSETQFRATWEHAALGTALLNRRGEVERVNPALERILGYPSAAWTGVAFDSFSHPDGAAAERERFASLSASGEAYYQLEQRYQRQDGTLIWGRVTVSAMRGADGELSGAVLFLEDVTARRQAEVDLRASEAQLRRAQKMEAVGQLVAGVAHNFNNLLLVTMGYSELLLARHTAPDQDRADLEEIHNAATRGAALTRQLLGFGREHEVKPLRIDLNRTVADLRKLLTGVLREDIQLTIDVEPVPAVVLINPNDLEQAILNLVMNARDAMPIGGTIDIAVARRSFDAASGPADAAIAPGEFICLRVRDNGSGMTAEVQSHLFEPFFTTKEIGKGTGLGLAFVYGIVRQHRGFITVDTAPAVGTTFTVCLPLAAGEATAGAIEPAPPSPVEGRRGVTVLLVEDDRAVREVTARTLRRAGYHVLEAATPSESYSLFDAHANAIDVLMADVIMPEMHGPALAQRLVSKRPQLRVLLVSGYSDALPVVTAPGKIAFLGKPFTAARLIATLAELLPQPVPDEA